MGWCRKWSPDGKIPVGVWRKWFTKRSREELLGGGLAVYTETGDIDLAIYRDTGQQSREEVDKARKQAQVDGAEGAHLRHHARRGISKPDTCVWCAAAVASAAPHPDPVSPPSSPPTPETVGPLPDPVRVGVAESEVETEAEKNLDRRLHLQVVDDARPEDDDRLHDRIDGEIRAVLGALTQVTVTPEHAARVRETILAGRSPVYPMAYVVDSVKKEPASWLPDSPRWVRRPAADPPAPPAYSTSVAEALARANPDAPRPPTVAAPAG
jgi:hypothetical protein